MKFQQEGNPLLNTPNPFQALHKVCIRGKGREEVEARIGALIYATDIKQNVETHTQVEMENEGMEKNTKESDEGV